MASLTAAIQESLESILLPTAGGSNWAEGAGVLGEPQQAIDMGVSENSVPLNPMVNDHYPY